MYKVRKKELAMYTEGKQLIFENCIQSLNVLELPRSPPYPSVT